eukprot:Phypoly_transcript_08373.p1 GENE.Phypoly_transcript_08373~~Phypoly_transcript_08373.p1  ORF type:complete len:465 (+),score=38.22 Phypoly_transcript_08373:78-1397(+)
MATDAIGVVVAHAWTYLSLQDLLSLSLLNTNFRAQCVAVIENNLFVNIPTDENVTTLAPKHVVIRSRNSLPIKPCSVVFFYDCDEEADSLPLSVRNLDFGIKFNHAIDHLPTVLSHLDLSEDFDLPVDYLPSSLTYILFGNAFNQPIDNLPSSITYISFMATDINFTDCFDHPIDHLPSSLTSLHLGKTFNQPIDHLPSSLTILQLSADFNHPVDHLPLSLKRLFFGRPSSKAKKLHHNYDFDGLFNHPVDNLPLTLTHLYLGYMFDQPVDHLPPSLTHLTFGVLFNEPVDNLPPLLTSLTLGSEFSHPVDHLPLSLSHLTFYPGRVEVLSIYTPMHHLPQSLTYFHLGYLAFWVHFFIPPSVHRLILHKSFDHKNLPKPWSTACMRKWDEEHYELFRMYVSFFFSIRGIMSLVGLAPLPFPFVPLFFSLPSPFPPQIY